MTLEELGLSERQIEVWKLTAEGLTIAEIAKKLCRSRGTCECHRSSLYATLKVTNTAQAARLAVQCGLVPVEWRGT